MFDKQIGRDGKDECFGLDLLAVDEQGPAAVSVGGANPKSPAGKVSAGTEAVGVLTASDIKDTFGPGPAIPT